MKFFELKENKIYIEETTKSEMKIVGGELYCGSVGDWRPFDGTVMQCYNLSFFDEEEEFNKIENAVVIETANGVILHVCCNYPTVQSLKKGKNPIYISIKNQYEDKEKMEALEDFKRVKEYVSNLSKFSST